LYRGTDAEAPLKYRHEQDAGLVPPGSRQRGGIRGMSAGQSVYATREGLVGGTTANGHVIVPHDHFVALPSRRALNANDTTFTYQVELAFEDRTVIAPVWDIGPWNTKDDYWNIPGIREMWSDLASASPKPRRRFRVDITKARMARGARWSIPPGLTWRTAPTRMIWH